MQVFVALEHGLHATGDPVVLSTDDLWGKCVGDGRERIHRWVDAQLSEGTLEHDGGVEVGEGRCRSRVSKVIRRDVDRLERSDRPFGGGSDSLLHRSHLGREGRLVTHSGWGAAEKCGHLGTSLRETENVVDEEQHVLVLLIAEELCHRESGERNAKTGTWRLVHLTVDQCHLGLAQVFLVDNASIGHFPVEIVALTGALTHTSKHGVTTVGFCDVVDEFHDDNCLANTSTTEGADFTTLGERADKVDDLNAGCEEFCGSGLLYERWRGAVDAVTLLEFHITSFIDRITSDVEDTT